MADKGLVKVGGIREYVDQIANAKRIIIIACGTSLHAGMVAKYLFEDICRVTVEVEYASEFRYRNPVIRDGDVVIAISQSGETADTLVAIEKAKEMGAIILGVCNVVGSSIPRTSHAGAYTHAGAEIGVASTKAFTAQLTVLYLIALQIAKEKGTMETERFRHILRELDSIPEKVQRILDNSYITQSLASLYVDATSMIYLGRGYNFPISLEGALKMKEISYIHAEGYPAAEMKHGPIALIDEDMPVMFIATKDATYEKIVSNIQEVKARKGKVIAIVTEGDDVVKHLADHVIEIPEIDEILTPLLSVIPLQLFAYYTGVLRGCNVDQPRNLAKSVTVE
jgi:glucosamine--fructose-6-phosphate aminotransferase (isomerizing)